MTNVGEILEKKSPSFTAGWVCNLVELLSGFWKAAWIPGSGTAALWQHYMWPRRETVGAVKAEPKSPPSRLLFQEGK